MPSSRVGYLISNITWPSWFRTATRSFHPLGFLSIHLRIVMDPFTLALKLGIGLVAVYVLCRAFGLIKATHPPLPPGPKGLPIVGNLRDLPKPGDLEAHHWLKHKYLYGSFYLSCCSPATKGDYVDLSPIGPISSITVMGQTIVILNDAQIALELLDKRAVKHSSRMKQTFAGEMYVWSVFPLILSPRRKELTLLPILGWAGRIQWGFFHTAANCGLTAKPWAESLEPRQPQRSSTHCRKPK